MIFFFEKVTKRIIQLGWLSTGTKALCTLPVGLHLFLLRAMGGRVVMEGTILELIGKQCSEYPSKEALQWRGKRNERSTTLLGLVHQRKASTGRPGAAVFSYGDLWHAASHVAAELQAHVQKCKAQAVGKGTSNSLNEGGRGGEGEGDLEADNFRPNVDGQSRKQPETEHRSAIRRPPRIGVMLSVCTTHL